MSHGVVAAIISVVWCVAFVIAVDHDVLYPVVGTVAALAIAVSLWRHRALGRELSAGPRVRHSSHALAAVRNGGGVAFDIVVGVVVGVALVVGTHIGFAVMVPVFPSLGDDVARLYSVAAVTPTSLVAVVLIAVAEEVVWRGLLQDALQRRFPAQPVVAVVGAAVIYAAAQLGPRSGWLLVAGVALGIVWGLMRLWRSLWMPIASHVVWTLCILGLAPLPAPLTP